MNISSRCWFQVSFIFTRIFWENDPIWVEHIFSSWLVKNRRLLGCHRKLVNGYNSGLTANFWTPPKKITVGWFAGRLCGWLGKTTATSWHAWNMEPGERGLEGYKWVTTWRIIPGLGYVVNKHGDRTSPKSRATWDFQIWKRPSREMILQVGAENSSPWFTAFKFCWGDWWRDQIGCLLLTLPETNSKFTPENRGKPKGKFIVFQPSIFRGYLCLVLGRVLSCHMCQGLNS